MHSRLVRNIVCRRLLSTDKYKHTQQYNRLEKFDLDHKANLYLNRKQKSFYETLTPEEQKVFLEKERKNTLTRWSLFGASLVFLGLYLGHDEPNKKIQPSVWTRW